MQVVVVVVVKLLVERLALVAVVLEEQEALLEQLTQAVGVVADTLLLVQLAAQA
jgi:uncharacterized membrane protein SirB2